MWRLGTAYSRGQKCRTVMLVPGTQKGCCGSSLFPRGLPSSSHYWDSATPPPLQAKLCYQDLRSALLLDPLHAQAKGLLQKMVDQAKQSLQDASTLAVQGKVHRALKCINCAIENNPPDPNFFFFRYWGTKGLDLLQTCFVVSGGSLNLPRLQSLSL